MAVIMAKQNNKILDTTETGPASYRELQTANNLSSEGLGQDFLKMIDKINHTYAPVSVYDTSRQGRRMLSSPLAMERYAWGESMWDKKSANDFEFQNLGDIRAENQPWYAKIGAGLAKGTIRAATTFITGIPELVIGIGMGVANLFDEDPNTGFVSGFTDNEFIKALNTFEKWADEVIPQYRTTEEQYGLWYKNIGANLIADQISNIGYMVGSFYGGGVAVKMLKGAGKLLTAAKWGSKAAKGLSKAAETIGAVKKASQFPALVSSAVGSTISAIAEASKEAVSGAQDWADLQNMQLDDEFGVVGGDTSHLTDEQYELYHSMKAKIEEDRIKTGNMNFKMQVPLLLASNIFAYGRMYANGFKSARMTNNIIKKAGTYAAQKSTAKNIVRSFGKAGMEGVEEVGQKYSSTTSGLAYEQDLNNFYEAKLDPEAEQQTIEWINAFSQGLSETFKDPTTSLEFFMGALMGAMGMPAFGRSYTSSTDTYLGRGKRFGLRGGIIGEMLELNQQHRRDEKIAAYLNNRVQSPDFVNYYQGLIRHNKYQNDMDNAVEDNDEFEFKNAEHSQLVSDIIMFDNAGKLEDLKSMISEAYDTSDENLESIIKNTTTKLENGELAGPFAEYATLDDNGNIVSNFGDENSKNEMKEHLTKNKDDIFSTIKNYQDIRDELDIMTGEQLTDEQLEELTWIKSKIGDWQSRSDSLSEEVKETLSSAYERMSEILDVIDDKENKAKLEKVQSFFKVLSKNSQVFAAYLASNPEAIEYYKDLLNNPYSRIDKDLAAKTKTQIDDLVKLNNAIGSFNTKLEEYLSNPKKQEENHRKVRENIQKKAQDKKVDDKSISDLARDIRNGEDVIPDDFEFTEDDETILNGTKEVTEERRKEAERKGKLNTARKVANTTNSTINKVRSKAKNSNVSQTATNMVERAAQSAESEEELFDLDSEAYNSIEDVYIDEEEFNSIVATLKEQGKSDEEIQEALYDIKEQELDEAKALLQEIKAEREKELEELQSMPKKEEVEAVREGSETKGADPVSSGEVVNSARDNSAGTKSKEEPIPDPHEGTKPVTEIPYDTPQMPNEERNYWKNNTTEVVKDNPKSPESARPYHEISKNPIHKAIHEFLTSVGAFARIKNNEVKKGQKVRFGISKSLSSKTNNVPVLLILDENGNVIGDLANPTDTAIFDKFSGLREAYDKAVTYYNQHANDNVDEDIVVIPSLESTVANIYVGRPMYIYNEDSTNNSASLNLIAGGSGKFKLGITMGNGSIRTAPNRRSSEGLSEEESKIIRPMNPKAGQPYVLIETSNPARKYMPVPIHMPKYTDETAKSMLGNSIKTLIYKLFSPEVLNSNNQQWLLSLKDELREFLAIEDLYIGERPGQYGEPRLVFTVKRYNSKEYITLLDTDYTDAMQNLDNIADFVLTRLQGLELPFQISRKYINSTVNGSDYNTMIGELARTNIKPGEMHTVNDFFTINPIVKGKQTKAAPIKSKQRDKANIRKAHEKSAEQEQQNRTPQPNQPNNEQPTTENNSNRDNDHIPAREFNMWVLKTTGFFEGLGLESEDSINAIFDKLSDDIIKSFSSLSEVVLKSKAVELRDEIDEDMSASELEEVFRNSLNVRNREATQNYEEADIEREIKRIRKILPQLSRDEAIAIVDSIIETSSGYAWGQFKKGLITLSRIASRGTAYHESFHYVFNMLMSKSEINAAYNAAKEIWGDLDPIALEENMAEDFRQYMQNEETFIGRLKNTWRRLKTTIRKLQGKNVALDNLYVNISKGRFANRKENASNSGLSKYNNIINQKERNDILKNAKRDSEGRLLAPNGKPSNLTEEQYIQVRTKAFKNWFGDWENDPANASKVVDENGEPLVVYHGTHSQFTIFKTMPYSKSIFFHAGTLQAAKEATYNTGIEMEVFLNIRKFLPVEKDLSVNGFTTELMELNKLGIINDDTYNNLRGDKSENGRKGLQTYLENKYGKDIGIKYINSIEDSGSISYEVISPNQIKLATDNIGIFNPNDPDIRYRELTKEEVQYLANNVLNIAKPNKEEFIKFKNSLLDRGYEIDGYYNESTKEYNIISVTHNPIMEEAQSIRQYHRDKYNYDNLTQEQKEYLSSREVSQEVYSSLTTEQKEILFKCMP